MKNLHITSVDEVADFIRLDAAREAGATMDEVIAYALTASGGSLHAWLDKYNTWISNGRPNPLTWNA